MYYIPLIITDFETKYANTWSGNAQHRLGYLLIFFLIVNHNALMSYWWFLAWNWYTVFRKNLKPIIIRPYAKQNSYPRTTPEPPSKYSLWETFLYHLRNHSHHFHRGVAVFSAVSLNNLKTPRFTNCPRGDYFWSTIPSWSENTVNIVLILLWL